MAVPGPIRRACHCRCLACKQSSTGVLGARVSKEVLIVEDDRALARLLERAIAAEGYRVAVVYDGDAALQKIRTDRPGMVLLDLLIPNKDGRAVLAALRGREDTKDLPVVVMTGIFRGRRHAADLEKAGAQAFLEKPFRRSDLSPLLRRHLGQARSAGPRRTASAELVPGEAISLVEHCVAKVMWNAMSQELSGALVFESGKRRKTLILSAGSPVQIGSNVARETLGNRLLSAGRIDGHALKESIARAREGEGRQGEILVRLGCVTQAEVDRALVSQSEEKLLELFSWADGEVVYRPDVTEVARASNLSSWTPCEAILRGIQLTSSKRVERLLAPFWDDRVELGPAELTDVEAAIPAVSAALSSLKVQRDAMVGEIAVGHGPALYGLHLVSAVSFSAAEERTERKVGGSGLAADEELRERIAEQENQTHFEVLGIKHDARAESVRNAFLTLAKRFHPDRYSSEGETRELAADVFARISRAHEVLSDSQARRDYIQALGRGAGSEGGERGVAQMLTAETQFQKGEANFRKREYGEALEQFRWALELNPDEGEFHAYYGWTFYLHNREDDETRSKAQEHLERAQRLSPNSPIGYYLMGLFRKACGDPRSAERMFKKTLEVSPSHMEANREIRLLNMRKGGKAATDKGKGFFGFGRKK